MWKVVIDNTAPVVSVTSRGDGVIPNFYKSRVIIKGAVGSQESNLASHKLEIIRPDGSVYSNHALATADMSYEYNLDTSGGDGIYKVKYAAIANYPP